MSSADFESAMKYISEAEGGANFIVVDGRPVIKNTSRADAGGLTKYGITEGTLRQANIDGVIDHRDIVNLTHDEAKEIYRVKYWDASKADRMKWGLCLVHFDAAVNHGVGGAARLLQKTLNSFGEKLSEDGAIGPLTLAAIGRYDVKKITAAYLDTREAAYRAIAKKRPSQKVFLKGWLNRIKRLRVGAGVSD